MGQYAIIANKHFVHVDFSDAADILLQFAAGEVIHNDEKGRLFLATLNRLDVEGNDIWNLDTVRTDWSLLGAIVRYNGKDRRTKYDKSFSRNVLVFTLNDVITPSGRFALSYAVGPQNFQNKKI